MPTLSERLKELRKNKQLTQKELAEKIGVKQNSYSDWENGKSEPNVTLLVRLASELNSSLDYLLGISDINIYATDIEEKFDSSPKSE